MIKAYARSAAHREAKLSADALQAGTVRSLSNVVVPINRRRRSALRR